MAGTRATTTEWVCRFISETSLTPLGHQRRWKSMRRRPVADHVVVWSKVLQTMLVYDQLDVSNLASAEIVARQIQLLEERDRDQSDKADKTPPAAKTPTSSWASRLRAAATAWLRSCRSELLRSSRLHKESAVLKERCKAQEECQLARKSARDAGK